MVKSNYAAWNIDSNEYSDKLAPIQKLEFFARYAILAPSGHNTQPWHFSAVNNSLVLSYNPSRHLDYSGTKAAEPYVSLGCCLETLIQAALGYGHKINVEYVFSGQKIAIINLGETTEAEPALITAILKRTSNRNLYDSGTVPKKLLEELTMSKNTAIQLTPVTSKADISYLAKQTNIATKEIMTDSKFRAELSNWVRTNVSKKHDGMPAFAQGMPLLLSLIARHVIKNFDISRNQAAKDSKRVLNSAALIIIGASDARPTSLLEAGRAYARICILAQKNHTSTSGVGAAAIDPKTRRAMMDHFSLSKSPLAIIRLGYTSKLTRHTPRWPLRKVSDSQL